MISGDDGAGTGRVYSIGHSNHSIEDLIALLKRHGVKAIGDVRSSPWSRYNPQFNRPVVEQALGRHQIEYVFLGRELGARPDDPRCYEDGRVSYDRLADTPAFQEGLSRVAKGARQYRLALMCAEKDPLECHRAVLVARHLEPLGFEVRHILASGDVETHGQAMLRLVRSLGIAETDLFRDQEELNREAYTRRGAQIAYTSDDHQGDAAPAELTGS